LPYIDKERDMTVSWLSQQRKRPIRSVSGEEAPYVSIRQHTSAAYVSIRQHTSAYVKKERPIRSVFGEEAAKFASAAC
jgi:hypothetical protein